MTRSQVQEAMRRTAFGVSENEINLAPSVRDYVVISEKGDTSWGGYAPDVPGCVAVGDMREEVERLFKEALEMHLEALREQGDPIPEPASRAGLVSVKTG